MVEGGEFCDMDGLFVGIKRTKDCAGVNVEHLRECNVSGCIVLYFALCKYSGVSELLGTLTWTKPASSPATTNLPSPRMHPLRATSLKREIVFVTFCVRGAYI